MIEKGDGFIILVEGPTGSGKSTIFPFVLARQIDQPIVVAVPTRTAAIGLARYVSSCIDGGIYRLPDGLADDAYAIAGGREIKFSGEIGFAVRGRKDFSERSRVIYATTGIALQMAADRSADFFFVVDEFHIRSIEHDALVGLLLHEKRPFALMSATMERDAERIVELANRNQMSVIRFRFPAIQHPVYRIIIPESGMDGILPHGELPQSAAGSLRDRSALWAFTAVLGLPELARRHQSSADTPPLPLDITLDTAGNRQRIAVIGGSPPLPLHILVFATGVRETEQLAEALRQVFDNEIYEMHGALAVSELEHIVSKAVDRSATRIFVSTDVSSVSVTLNAGVVIDPLQRKRGEDIGLGFGIITPVPLSRAEAMQRKGRAGRTAPGIYVVPHDESQLHNDFPPPEVTLRSPERLVMASLAVGIHPTDLELPDPIPNNLLVSSISTLRMLGCVEDDGGDRLRLTGTGWDVFRLGLPARLGVPIVRAMREEKQDKMILPLIVAVVSVLAPGRGLSRMDRHSRGPGRPVRRTPRLDGGDVELAIRALAEFARLYSPGPNSDDRTNTLHVGDSYRKQAFGWATENGLIPRVLEEAITIYYPDIAGRIGWDEFPSPDRLLGMGFGREHILRAAAWLAAGFPDRIGLRVANTILIPGDHIVIAHESAMPFGDVDTDCPMAVVLNGFAAKFGMVATFAAPLRLSDLVEIGLAHVERDRDQVVFSTGGRITVPRWVTEM